MPVAWSDDFTGVDWASVDVLNMFHVAIWERAYAIASYIATPSPAPETVAGDDVQSHSFWSMLQEQAEGVCGGFFRTDFNPEGQTAYQYASLWSGFEPFWTPESVFEQMSTGGWMRKRPREISALDQWGDNDGNAPVAAHRARHTATGKVYFWNDGEFLWEEEAPDVEPDLLIGEAGLERTIEANDEPYDSRGQPAAEGMRARGPDGQVYEFGYEHDEPPALWYQPDEPDPTPFVPDIVPTGYGVIFGRCKAGDYIGAWLLTELRDFLNALGTKTQAGTVLGSTYAKSAGNNFTYPASSADEAKAWAEAAWAVATGGTPQGAASVRGRLNEHPTFEDQWVGTLSKSMTEVSVKTNSHRSRSASLFGAFHPWAHPTDSGDADQAEYTGPGSPDTTHAWQVGITLAAGTDQSAFYTQIADGTSIPAWPTPLPNKSNDRGYIMGLTFAVVDWEFEYGGG